MALALRFPICGEIVKKAVFSPKGIRIFQPITTSSLKLNVNEDFWEKNKRLERPLSPHLTIYKYQLTAVLSITHRATGMTLAAGLYGLSLGMLLLPASFPHYIDVLQAMHIGPLICLTKFGLAWSFFFHFCNGIRHLAWDLGYGFEISDLYKTGYVVLGVSMTAAVIAAFM